MSDVPTKHSRLTFVRGRSGNSTDFPLLQDNTSMTGQGDDVESSLRPQFPKTTVTIEDATSLGVIFYRFRLLASSVLLVAMIVFLMTLFATDGVMVSSFRADDKNDSERKTLLDWYNSVSGNIVSLATKLVDIFLGMVVAVAFLCFFVNFTLYGRQTWYAEYIVLATTTFVAYLVSNGFNALNVQIVPGLVDVRIAAQDLALTQAVQDDQPLDSDGSLITTWDKKYLETNPENSVLNTILRNLFIPTIQPPNECNKTYTAITPIRIPDASFGFPSREWQQHALSTAITPINTLTIPLNTEEDDLPLDLELPMNVSIASNIFLYGMLSAYELLGWWNRSTHQFSGNVYLAEMKRRYQFSSNATGALHIADLLHLPTSISSDDPSKFLRAAQKLAVSAFSSAEDMDIDDGRANVKFNRFQLSHNIVFDAMTIEIPRAKIQYNRSAVTDESVEEVDAVYSDVGFDSCSTNACLIAKPEVYGNEGRSITVAPRVRALAMCLNKDGEEELMVTFNSSNAFDDFWLDLSCQERSNNSMMVVGVGKHIEGDKWDKVTNSNLSASYVRLQNSRIVYSLTAGRLSWQPEDLAVTYGATCENREGGCEGLRFELESTNGKRDHLVVGKDSLPLDMLSTLNFYSYAGDPTVYTNWKSLITLPGDPGEVIAFPRHFSNVTHEGTAIRKQTECYAVRESFINYIEKNHLYMEESVQASYISAFYFLFQNGVVQQALNTENTTTTAPASVEPLAFVGNIQQMNVQASIPTTNICFTLVGCALLLVMSIIIAILGKRSARAIEDRVTPHIFMEAIIDRTKFPPFFMKMTLEEIINDDYKEVLLDQLRIKSAVIVDDHGEQAQLGLRS